jgi:hypothetical protein
MTSLNFVKMFPRPQTGRECISKLYEQEIPRGLPSKLGYKRRYLRTNAYGHQSQALKWILEIEQKLN